MPGQGGRLPPTLTTPAWEALRRVSTRSGLV